MSLQRSVVHYWDKFNIVCVCACICVYIENVTNKCTSMPDLYKPIYKMLWLCLRLLGNSKQRRQVSGSGTKHWCYWNDGNLKVMLMVNDGSIVSGLDNDVSAYTHTHNHLRILFLLFLMYIILDEWVHFHFDEIFYSLLYTFAYFMTLWVR